MTKGDDSCMDTIVTVDTLPAVTRTDSTRIIHGYWVEAGWLPPLFFPALEPAYAYGRAARMATGIDSWRLSRAAYEITFSPDLDRDTHQVHVLREDVAYRSQTGHDQQILRRFAEGVDPKTSSWPVP